MKPKYIAIEGGEGSGKTTALKAAKAVLGDLAIFIQEPGTTEFANALREVMFKKPFSKQASADSIHAAMWSARYDIIKNAVFPAIEGGRPVISDRSLASSYAYNVYAQTQMGLEKAFHAFKERLQMLPDLTIFLDVLPSEGLRRARSRNSGSADGNHFDDLDVSFHRSVREGYHEYLLTVPHIIIDANRSIEAVQADFLAAIQHELAS